MSYARHLGSTANPLDDILSVLRSSDLTSVQAGHAVLQRGSKGPAVMALQQIVRNAQVLDGATDLIVVDGVFGPGTEAAVRRLQQSLGVPVDGKVGKGTLAALEARVAGAGTATAANRFEDRRPVLSKTEKAERLKQAKAAAIQKAREEAKGILSSKIRAMRDRGAADARAGKYQPPAPVPPPDFDLRNYQAGWLSTGISLPSGVKRVVIGEEAPADEGGVDSKLLIGGAVAAAVVAVILLR